MEQTHGGLTYEQAAAIAAANGETLVRAYCPMCGPNTKCRIYAFVRDGRLLRVAGMAESPWNRGGLCAKGLAAPEWNASPERLHSPLLRVGEKGEGKFREITWDEALDILAEKLKEQKAAYGPESLAILSPAGREYKEISLRFLAVHGSPNHAHSGICAMQNSFSFCYTIGSRPRCDYANADLLIYWGCQPAYSGPAGSGARNLVSAADRGAKIVTVKPSLEPDGAMGSLWIPVRPGTDAALALAMLHVVIREDLVDHAFVEQWCYGFEALKAHVTRYTPEWAERITGVAAAQIEDFARLYAATPRAAIDVGNGLEHAASASDAVRAIASLMAITGHLDRKGCNLLGAPKKAAPKSVMRFDLYTDALVDKLVAPEMPRAFMPFREGPASGYYKTLESVLTGKPYPVRTLIAPGTQPLVSTRGTKKVLEALKKVDFYVLLDVMRTAELPYADLVLPVATMFEAEHPFGVDGDLLVPRPACVPPLGDYKTIYHFFLELARRMGYGAEFWNGDYDAFENERLSPFGLTIDELRRHPEGVEIPRERTAPVYENYAVAFAAKSNRVSRAPYLPQGKVALYNTSFEAAGYAPLPEYREPAESLTGSPELTKRYPLLLSDYHTSRAYSAGWLRNVPSLRAIQPEPALEIHPIPAAQRGISDGDLLRVESPHGWLILKAEVTERIRPDTVMVLHGWWQGCRELGYDDLPLTDGGANVNNLYDVSEKAFDPLVTAMASQTLVEVTKL